MHRIVNVTDLSVKHPDTGKYYYEMGEGDRRTFGFSAEEDGATATATVIALAGGRVVAGVVTGVQMAGQVANVTVDATAGDRLRRGGEYELRVTFTPAVGGPWTRTLVLIIA